MKQIELKVNHLQRNTTQSYIEQYLGFLGIAPQNVSSFINIPKEEDQDNPYTLNNIEVAVKKLHEKLMEPHCSVFVQVDSDTDGFTSSSIFINYLQTRFPDLKINYALHHGKEHGVELNAVPAGTTVVIIPDAGSNQYEEQETLVKEGKTVIVLDHHEVTNFRETGAIIVNNQISENFTNKNLSGAGVVYMFIKVFDDLYFSNNPIHRDYLDLAAIGIIADAMNMTALGNNYIAYWGLQTVNNKFMYTLARKQERGIKNPNKLTKIDVAFYMAPVINGVIRSGSMEDKELVFKALITQKDDNDYTRVWRGVTYHENFWEMAVRIALNAKGRQDAAKKKSFEWLCEKIRKNCWDKDNVIIATMDEKESTKVSPNITGLIAMELVKEFNKPALVLRATEFNGMSVYGGSGRNGNFYGLSDLKSFMSNAGAYYAEGHANAFGCFLVPDQVQQIRNYANSHLDAATFNNTVYEVDYWFHTGESLDKEMLFELASYEDLWGNSIPQPKIAADVNYKMDDILIMGKNNDSLKIKIDGVDFVAFKCADLIQQIKARPEGHATIVGRPQLNVWLGKASVQMVIDDIEIFTPAAKKVSALDLI